jgi:hypothetical protein
VCGVCVCVSVIVCVNMSVCVCVYVCVVPCPELLKQKSLFPSGNRTPNLGRLEILTSRP